MLRLRRTQEQRKGKHVKVLAILTRKYNHLFSIPYKTIKDCNACDAMHEVKSCRTLDNDGQTCYNNRFYFIAYGCSIFLKCTACGQLHTLNELRYKS